MYCISLRLSKILNVTDLPFGGMNMLFAGDFAQLPPAIGQEHAALYSRTVGSKSTSLRDQKAAIGKALWHQVTTIVILRQNMRQKLQTKEDASLREALSNIRYKACTPSDIVFLRSRISSLLPGRPAITQDNFQDVSIITALNVHKDEINHLGSLRFGKETSQNLIDFFSEDTVTSTSADKGTKQVPKKSRRKAAVNLTDQVQQALWNQPPSATDKCIAGKLSLCVGMPVIICSNSATELCITRGQEAIVHCWQSSTGAKGQRVLDTLFVELQHPPKNVQFEGLPLNVVPLTRSSVSVKCSLPNDEFIMISRSQVEVLPNFAMTDYSSQGKT
jgi:predicted XRE-type DNA-binding protein